MRRFLTVLSVPILTLLATGPAMAQWYGNHGMGWGPSEGGWGHMIFGGFMMIAFWGAIILLVVVLVRWLSGGHAHGGPIPGHKPPLQILQERFAKGEIDKEEYEERRRLLAD
jgi:putative membrane protein